MNRNVIRLVVLASVFLVPSKMAWSQPPADAQFLSERVSFSFQQAEVSAIIRFLAQARGLEAVIDPALTRKVSFRLEQVTVRTALDALCDSARCRWRLEGKKLVFEALEADVSRSESDSSEEHLAPLMTVVPAGTQFTNVSLSTALRGLAAIAGGDVELDVEGVDTTRLVTGNVGSKTVQAAVRQLLASAGLKVGSPYVIVFNRPTKKLRVLGVLTNQELE